MNIIQRLLARLGRQYVVLVWFDGRRDVRRAYALGDHVYANPYLPDTRCKLLPGGKTKGMYIHGWEPITPRTKALFNSLSYAEAVKRSDEAEVIPHNGTFRP